LVMVYTGQYEGLSRRIQTIPIGEISFYDNARHGKILVYRRKL